MNHQNKLIKDPVCGMMVEPQANAIEYLQIHFAFCSKQCKDRFIANPRLYIGYPEQKSPKQEGMEVIKRRRIPLSHPLSTEGKLIVEQSLTSMMGIKDIIIGEDAIVITYDLLQATLELIETKLASIGTELGGNWAERLRDAFIHQSEELEIDSLEIQQPRHR